MADVLRLAVSVRPSSLTVPPLCDRQTCRQTVQKAPGVVLSNCLFFSFCDCNKSTLRKAILNFVCFYFMVITIVILMSLSMIILFCFLCVDDYLNAKKIYNENFLKKKEEKT